MAIEPIYIALALLAVVIVAVVAASRSGKKPPALEGDAAEALPEPEGQPEPTPTPETALKPKAAPTPTPTPTPTPEPAPKPKAEPAPTLAPKAEAKPAPTPEPAPKAEAEPASELEPAPKPKAEAEPTSEPAPEAEAEPEPEPTPEPEPEKTMAAGLAKTRQGFMARLNSMLFGAQLDEEALEDIEALLVTSDIGVRTAQKLIEEVRGALSRSEAQDPEAIRTALRERIRQMVELPCPAFPDGHGPAVIMVIGVNGVGKTTTIGKLAARLIRAGKSVTLAAGDTFRAAAVEQLEIWGKRTGATVIRGKDKADPSSVVFEAIQAARANGSDVCICDTAGRLHTKVNLMEELKKLRRTMDKAHPGAPHEVLMVLDATTGQNAIAQARQFREAVNIDTIALTKLDGTAKGGVVVAICDELQIPVRLVGIGEKVDDLRDFHPEDFVDALFS